MTQAPFSAQEHLGEVLSRYEDSPNERLAEITAAAVRHLHDFVVEVGLTRDEWFAGIEALTRVGQMCDAQRQEFILLSDTLGVSMLVEMINLRSTAGTTEPTVFGPFHVDGAPRRERGDSIAQERSEAEEIVMSGTVLDTDGQPVSGAKLTRDRYGWGFGDVRLRVGTEHLSGAQRCSAPGVGG